MSSQERQKKRVTFRDLRTNRLNSCSVQEFHFDVRDVKNIVDIRCAVKEKIKTEQFVLCMPNRVLLCDENLNDLRPGDLVLILLNQNQPLDQEVKSSVNIAPHPDTITRSGMYEYYSSCGIDSVVISIAELIDNSLAATKDNDGLRLIEIRFYDDGNNSMLCILDNGHGMEFFGLTEWAKFKNSKFVRKHRFVANSESLTKSTPSPSTLDSGYLSFSSASSPLRQPSSIPSPTTRYGVNDAYYPRYLDSAINYFGAGGKQAVFNIGEKITMVSKIKDNIDICELTLSKEEFDSKVHTSPDDVYKVEQTLRSIGVERILPQDLTSANYIENQVIKEMEQTYDNFSCCFIKNIININLSHFRKGTDSSADWTKNLSRIYHYYLHGPKGNTLSAETLPPELDQLKILIKIYNVSKSGGAVTTHERSSINLRHIDDDYETQLIRSAAATFEFDVVHEDKSNIEGVIRYHPYLHDHESLPRLLTNDDLCETTSISSRGTDTSELNLEDDEEFRRSEPFKHKDREVFECFWHGRLIPGTRIDFDWNKYNHKLNKNIEECFNRLSGALFTNHSYIVTQNKQTFTDLSQLMAQNNKVSFFKVYPENGGRHQLRGNFTQEFVKWITECHTKYDKQVKYSSLQGYVTRTSIPSLRKLTRTDTFTIFNQIEWKGKKWKKGDKIKTKETRPSNLIGAIERFLVPLKISKDIGTYDGSPGFVEISELPAEIYGTENDSKKICAFFQVNTDITEQEIEEELEKCLDKLPNKILIKFPREFPIREGDEIPAGQPIGDIQAFVQNSNGVNLLGKIPYKIGTKDLRLQLKILRKESDNETVVEVEYPISKSTKLWNYWFKRHNEGIRKTGSYVLKLVAIIKSDDGREALSEFPNKRPLPSAQPINFTVAAGPPKRFTICEDKVTALIGVSFDLTLQFLDEFDNEAKPLTDPPILRIDGFEISYESVDLINNRCIIRNVSILGKINFVSDEVILEIYIPSLGKKHELSVVLKPGPPYSLIVNPEEQIELTNGCVPYFGASVYDKGENDVTFSRRSPYQVCCKFYRIKENGQKYAVSREYHLSEGMADNRRCLILKDEIMISDSEENSQSCRSTVAKFYLKSDPKVSLERQMIVNKNLKPSVMKLFYTKTNEGESETIEIVHKSRLEFLAGSTLTGIFFKAYDCDGTQIVLPDLNASVLTISWTDNPRLYVKDGALPDIEIATSTQDKRLYSIKWRPPESDRNLELYFSIQVIPDQPNRLTINSLDKKLVFPLGEVVTDKIFVTVLDRYNNIIRSNDVMNRIVIRPNSQCLKVDQTFIRKSIARKANEGSFVINGIKLVPNLNNSSEDSVLGKTELSFNIDGFEKVLFSYILITVVNGIPKYLKWFNDTKYDGVIVVANNNCLQIQTRLYDDYSNPIHDSRLKAKLVLGKDFLDPELTSDLDSGGVTTFSGIIKMKPNGRCPTKCSIPNEISRDLTPCQTCCYGFTKIIAEVTDGRKLIKSTPYWLHIPCDSKSPARLSITHLGSLKVITHTSGMPTIVVTVLAEDDTIIRNVDKDKISMHLLNNNQDSQEFCPTRVQNGIFYFKPDMAPYPDRYQIKIVYDLKTIETFYKEEINIIPGLPTKILLKSKPPNDPIIVSNTENSRTIVDRKSPLLLDLVDSNDVPIYENISEQQLERNLIYSGTLRACVLNDNKEEIPELEGCDSKKSSNFWINGGKAVINELKLKTGTRAKDSGYYSIGLFALLNDSRIKLKPFELRILFCDDPKKQTQLNEIQISINSGRQRRQTLSKRLEECQTNKESQTKSYNSCILKETHLRDELKKLGEQSHLKTEQSINWEIDQYKSKQIQIEMRESDRTIRGLNLSVAPKRDGLVGRIGHLASIEDNETALIISWFLKDYMKCIVTRTSEEAEKIMNENNEEMNMTYPLDQIRDGDLPKQWFDRLPHENKFDVCYNVGYARNRLEFEDFEDETKKVFGSLLKNTLIMDTIKDAKAYRKKFRPDRCPTILTRSGYMLYENGIIDRTAPIDNFNSVAFQSPPNKELFNSSKIIELLEQLSRAVKQTQQELKSLESLTKDYEITKSQIEKDLEEVDREISFSEFEFKRLLSSEPNRSDGTHEKSSSNNNQRINRRSHSKCSSDPEPNSKRARV